MPVRVANELANSAIRSDGSEAANPPYQSLGRRPDSYPHFRLVKYNLVSRRIRSADEAVECADPAALCPAGGARLKPTSSASKAASSRRTPKVSRTRQEHILYPVFRAEGSFGVRSLETAFTVVRSSMATRDENQVTPGRRTVRLHSQAAPDTTFYQSEL